MKTNITTSTLKSSYCSWKETALVLLAQFKVYDGSYIITIHDALCQPVYLALQKVYLGLSKKMLTCRGQMFFHYYRSHETDCRTA